MFTESEKDYELPLYDSSTSRETPEKSYSDESSAVEEPVYRRYGGRGHHFKGKGHRKHKKSLRKKALIGSTAVLAGFSMFTLGRIYEDHTALKAFQSDIHATGHQKHFQDIVAEGRMHNFDSEHPPLPPSDDERKFHVPPHHKIGHHKPHNGTKPERHHRPKKAYLFIEDDYDFEGKHHGKDVEGKKKCKDFEVKKHQGKEHGFETQDVEFKGKQHGKKFRGKKHHGKDFEGEKHHDKDFEGKKHHGKENDLKIEENQDKDSEIKKHHGKDFEGKKHHGKDFEGKKHHDKDFEGKKHHDKDFEGKKHHGKENELKTEENQDKGLEGKKHGKDHGKNQEPESNEQDNNAVEAESENESIASDLEEILSNVKHSFDNLVENNFGLTNV